MRSVGSYINKIFNPFLGTIIYFEAVSSTMDVAKQYSLQSGDLIITDYQWTGYGRNIGCIWDSLYSHNLLFTLVFSTESFLNKPVVLLSALAIVEFLKNYYGICARIKWPNDVLVDGKKISGIVGEIYNENILLGIGININQLYFSQINSRTTSLGCHVNFEIDLRRVLVKVLQSLHDVFYNQPNWNRAVNRCLFGKDISKKYLLFGKRDNSVFGKSFAIQEDGALVVFTDTGVFCKIYITQ